MPDVLDLHCCGSKTGHTHPPFFYLCSQAVPSQIVVWPCDFFFGQWDNSKCDTSRGLKNAYAFRLVFLLPFETPRPPCEDPQAYLLKGERITSADIEPTASHRVGPFLFIHFSHASSGQVPTVPQWLIIELILRLHWSLLATLLFKSSHWVPTHSIGKVPAYPQNCESWLTVLSYFVLGWFVPWQKLFSFKFYC